VAGVYLRQPHTTPPATGKETKSQLEIEYKKQINQSKGKEEIEKKDGIHSHFNVERD
jgi:hypothetical protein